ncbi:MAG TPA: 2'-5' RNA ligase family protein [Synechococcales cyanobacterium M55_K2018_004]|nr:2'-5' RNA ligase family protein [Synechococcales cyanobacterium M55_K2018_004]
MNDRSSPDRPANVRFFVALIPPQEIQDYATTVIQELGDRFQTRTAKAPPHVTLYPPFEWPRKRSPELEDCLAQFAAHHAGVPVSLSGFGAFSPRVLYINVLKTPELLHLQANLMAHLEATLGIVDVTAKRRPFAPHLTVASRNVTRQTFREAWALLQDRSVAFEFLGDRLTLLRHDGGCWQIQRNFSLVHYPP